MPSLNLIIIFSLFFKETFQHWCIAVEDFIWSEGTFFYQENISLVKFSPALKVFQLTKEEQQWNDYI